MVTCRTYTIEKAPTPGFTLTADQYEEIGPFNTTLQISYPIGAGQIVKIVNSDPTSGDSCLTTDIPLDGNGDATVPYSVIGTHTIYAIKTTGTGGENCCTSFSQTLCQYSNYVTFTVIQPILTSIEISSPITSVVAEDTIQFTASCKDQSTNPMTCPTLTWDSNNASVGTINQSGLFTATNVITQGTTDITVSSSNITSNIITITVTPHILTSISISPINPTIQAGNTTQFTASCKDQSTNPMICPTLIWNSNNTSVGTINQSGLFTATNVITQGTTDITAYFSNITSNISIVTVTPPPDIGNIQFLSNPSGAQIWLAPTGQTPVYQNKTTTGTITNLPIGNYDYILKLTNYNDYTSPQPVTIIKDHTAIVGPINLIPAEGCIYFTSSPPGARIFIDTTLATVTDTGFVTPKLICNLGLWQHCYKLVLVGYEDKTGCITLITGEGETVADTLIELPVLTDITISPLSPLVTVGRTRTFNVIPIDQYGNPIPATITWNSSNTYVGIINPDTGVFSAEHEGSTVITATSGTINKSTIAIVTSEAPVLTTIIISPTTLSIEVGNSNIFTASPKDQFGDPFPATVTWGSSNTNIGTIDSLIGIFTAISQGSTIITATSGTVSGISVANVTTVTPPTQFGILGNINDAALILAGAMMASVMITKYQKVRIEQTPELEKIAKKYNI